MKLEAWQLNFRKSLPLWIKEAYTAKRIKAWYERWGGNVYVAFSGGKDSTVLLDQVRKLYPNVPAVFIDTGLEFPEIRDFVRTIKNVIWLKPNMTFKEVLEKHGYPVISKKISMGVSRCRRTKDPETQIPLRLYGGTNPTSGKKQHPTVSKKWHFLLDAPFKISEACCDVMKKSPFKKFNKTSGLKSFTGMMAVDSDIRRQYYLQRGCNAFEAANPTSTPMAFWIESDIWEYIKKYDLAYSKIYDMGYDRTGCAFCMFGVHMEKGENRFLRMYKTHRGLWNYCIQNLGLNKVLDYIKIPYHPDHLTKGLLFQ